MQLVIGADHAGFPLKEQLLPFLRQNGHSVLDVGTFSTAPVDYPDYSEAVALAVRDGRAERGILICGSGVGASVAANKIPGIRCSNCDDTYSAHQGVEHDNMNVIALGARVIAYMLAEDLVSAYLKAQFTGEARHVRRLEKIRLLEVKYGNHTEYRT
jgi:ribose 5-phosphate isomerase B